MFGKAFKAIFGERGKSSPLDASMQARASAELADLPAAVEIVATLDDGEKSSELRSLLEALGEHCAKLSMRFDGDDARKPSYSVGTAGETARVRFAALPTGNEFASLLRALALAGGKNGDGDAALAARVRALDGPLHFETYITMPCHNCPDVVQALNQMALLNPAIRHTTIDGHLFLDEIKRHAIDAVPAVRLNGEALFRGRKGIAEILARLAPEPATAPHEPD